MQASVNWYFEEIDQQIGRIAIQNYIGKIGYGNEIVNADLSSYWMQGELKISPVEQVELLTALHNNQFDFATNIQNDSDATGSKAAEITKAVLSDLNLWK